MQDTAEMSNGYHINIYSAKAEYQRRKDDCSRTYQNKHELSMGICGDEKDIGLHMKN